MALKTTIIEILFAFGPSSRILALSTSLQYHIISNDRRPLHVSSARRDKNLGLIAEPKEGYSSGECLPQSSLYRLV
jgi:hypothetical protein